MGEITTIQNKEFGEIRIGVDDDTPKDACVTLALNHWEDDEKWGGQPLTPQLARHIGCVLIEYAAKAKEIQSNYMQFGKDVDARCRFDSECL